MSTRRHAGTRTVPLYWLSGRKTTEMSQDIELYDEADLITKLTRDLKKAAGTLKKPEVRFLVDAYYRMQENRIRYAHQIRTMKEFGEPNELLEWFFNQAQTLEKQIAGALDAYSKSNDVGLWMRSIPGIGPVIAAGFMAHLEIAPWRCNNVALKGKKNLPCTAEKGACTDECGHAPINYAGQWHTFAGLNPRVSWSKGQRRPWNTALKTLCYKLGESFVKVQNHKDDFYGQIFVTRKHDEWMRNFNGENAKAAELALKKNIGQNTNAYKWYSGQVDAEWAETEWNSDKSGPKFGGATLPKKGLTEGGTPMLPPAHIHARARRYVVKLFLFHLHEVMWNVEQGEAPPQQTFFADSENSIAVPTVFPNSPFI